MTDTTEAMRALIAEMNETWRHYTPDLCDKLQAALASHTVPDWMPTQQAADEAREGGYFHSCSGCHESDGGYETGNYPYSPVYQCHVGSGCVECGGLGVIWNQMSDKERLWAEAPATDREA